jgi:molybdopterin converting factor small subunit
MGNGTAVAVNVQYYALFREQRGLSSEQRTTEAATLRQLYEELAGQFRFSLPSDRVQVAVDDEFADWDQPVKANSRIVFIPPVAGG